MEIKTGEMIKKLRKKHDVTQEKLADYLGISYQAVSKWENGSSLPDITLIPVLANFFGVSTDELFGISPQHQDQKTAEFETEYNRLHSTGDISGMTVLMRKALEEYPRNYGFMLKLAQALSSLNAFNATKKQEKESTEEAVKLCERILEDCTEDPIRHHAVQILCSRYPLFGKMYEAEKLAENMPTMKLCKETLLENLLTGDLKIKQVQENLLQYIDLAATALIRLALDRTMGKNLTYEQKIQFVEASSKLYAEIMPEGNYLFYHSRLAWNYRRLAELWCAIGDTNSALQCLGDAAKHAECYDNLPESTEYSSVFIQSCSYIKTDAKKDWMGTECGMLYYRMSESVFDLIRDLPKFRSISEEFKKKNETS